MYLVINAFSQDRTKRNNANTKLVKITESRDRARYSKPTKAHSQSNKPINKPTKEETQQWIKEKIGSYAFNSDDGKIKNQYLILYEGQYIKIKNINYASGTDESFTTRIPVIDIEYISFAEKSDNYWLIINVKSSTIGYTFSNTTSTKYHLDGKYEMLLDKKFKDNDLPIRMKKAFSRLVELYGGKAVNTKEAY